MGVRGFILAHPVGTILGKHFSFFFSKVLWINQEERGGYYFDLDVFLKVLISNFSQTEGLKNSEDNAAKAERAGRRESEDKRTEGKKIEKDTELKKTKGDMNII